MGIETPIKHDGRWPVVSLAEITTKIGSGATPKGGTESYLPARDRFALVRSQNVFDRRFERSGLAFITDEQAAKLRASSLNVRDILLNITGDGITFGRACLVPKDVLPARVNQHVSIIRVDPQFAEPGYVLAFLTHPAVKPYIESFNAGGSRRAVTKGHIESFRLPLPSLPEQRAIAHVLGTLDDKIELNRRMNETLEGMARALFKSWFVDFDPVRAKTDRRWQSGESLPGLPADLYDLFPDRLVESEPGGVPEGWEIRPLGDLVSLGRETVKPMERTAELFEHFSIPAFDENKMPAQELGREIRSNKYLVPSDAILVSKLNPRIPRVWLPAIPARHRAICSTEFLVVRPEREGSRSWFFCLFLSDVFIRRFGGLVTGTSGSHQRVRPKAFEGLPAIWPPEGVRVRFASLADPFLGRVEEARRESLVLAGLRDTLLSKLISGELRIAAAERFAGSAV